MAPDAAALQYCQRSCGGCDGAAVVAGCGSGGLSNPVPVGAVFLIEGRRLKWNSIWAQTRAVHDEAPQAQTRAVHDEAPQAQTRAVHDIDESPHVLRSVTYIAREIELLRQCQAPT